MKSHPLLALLFTLVYFDCLRADDPIVGPQTEERFPPLVVPDGFKATLFACDPLVEYPSVIALGPREQTLFVAHDYVTGLGVEIVRRDEVRLIEDTDSDGYADKSTVFAKGFNSIQGLAFYDGEVFVMHAPLLTSLKDTDGDDVADARRDLIAGLGLPPEENSNRLHCANGVVPGHDDWLYLALGDRGCDVQRPEGDRLLFQQGGILRCRRDGTDLHVFSTGLRNTYDLALDAELNVFLRDNENDGGDFMIRVCHCFFGSDHGYPYHYYEHPNELMPPLADLGRGSSAGVTTYLETAFPQEFQKSLICCEWGRAVVRYPLARSNSSFEPTTEIDFAAGAQDDLYPFKPTDLVVDRDGSLLVSDWCDGQRPKRGRARIYRIKYEVKEAEPEEDVGKPTVRDWIRQLSSPGYHKRLEAQLAIEADQDGCEAVMDTMKNGEVNHLGRMHAIWILANVRGAEAIDDLFKFAQTDGSIPVRVQAVRAIADLTDPILVKDKVAAGPGDVKIAERLSKLRVERDPRLLLEVTIALGRLIWKDAPRWVFFHINCKPDPAVAHAASWTFRAADNWPYVFSIWDNPFSPSRPAALVAAAEQTNPIVVDALLERAKDKPEYAKLLARVYKKPGPYEYWGFRPAERAPNPVAWERTDAIKRKLIEVFALRDAGSAEIRKQILREGVPIPVATLVACLSNESDEQRLAIVLNALKEQTDESIPGHFADLVRSKLPTNKSRLTALQYLVEDLNESNEEMLVAIAQSVEDGDVLAETINQIGSRANLNCNDFLLAKLSSKDGAVRSAAIRSLAVRKHAGAAASIEKLLDDTDVRVRRSAALAAGKLHAKQTTDRLLELTDDDDLETCRLSLDALRVLNNADAVNSAVAGLDRTETQLAALAYLAVFGDAKQLEPVMKVAESSRSIEVLTSAARSISAWHKKQAREEFNQAIARIHGRSGVVLRWTTFGPLTHNQADALGKRLPDPTTKLQSLDVIVDEPTNRRTNFANGTEARIVFDKGTNARHVPVFMAVAEVQSDEETNVEFIGSSDGDIQIWLNKKLAFKRHDPKFHPYQANADRFAAVLPKGTSRLVVRIDLTPAPPKLHLRFRQKSSKAEHERLIKLALVGRGNVKRGQEVFVAADKSQCIKCHRIDEKGGRIGPDLAGIGSRFSRIHLIESILEPSRTVAPSYGSINVALSDGRVLTGVKVKEDEKTLTLGDNQGKMHAVAKSEIDQMRTQTLSTMPDGLERRLTDREFIDLLAYLLSLKK